MYTEFPRAGGKEGKEGGNEKERRKKERRKGEGGKNAFCLPCS